MTSASVMPAIRPAPMRAVLLSLPSLSRSRAPQKLQQTATRPPWLSPPKSKQDDRRRLVAVGTTDHVRIHPMAQAARKTG
eukprot:294566-Chlamydomonas_euryale.AAC.1